MREFSQTNVTTFECGDICTNQHQRDGKSQWLALMPAQSKCQQIDLSGITAICPNASGMENPQPPIKRGHGKRKGEGKGKGSVFMI